MVVQWKLGSEATLRRGALHWRPSFRGSKSATLLSASFSSCARDSHLSQLPKMVLFKRFKFRTDLALDETSGMENAIVHLNFNLDICSTAPFMVA